MLTRDKPSLDQSHPGQGEVFLCNYERAEGSESSWGLLQDHMNLPEVRTNDLTPSTQDRGFQRIGVMVAYFDPIKDGGTEIVGPVTS